MPTEPHRGDDARTQRPAVQRPAVLRRCRRRRGAVAVLVFLAVGSSLSTAALAHVGAALEGPVVIAEPAPRPAP